MSDEQDKSFDDELYKHLIQETSKYIEKVHQTWNQKLIIVGAMIAFLLSKDSVFGVPNAPSPPAVPLSVVILAIPILCVILDAHLLEKALHSRILSHFLVKEFENKNLVKRWFRMFWSLDQKKAKGPIYYIFDFWRGGKNMSVETLVGMRSATTSLVTVVPTVVAVVLATYTVTASLSFYVATTAIAGAFLFCLVYCLGAVSLFRNFQRHVEHEAIFADDVTVKTD